MDREFATKVARKDGRESKLAVAWKVEVLAVIDARGTGEKPFSNGIRDVQSKSLSPDGAILGNVIRQGEEVQERDGVGCEATFSRSTASICDLFGLAINNGWRG